MIYNMTARTQTLIVALDKEYRDDDIEHLIKAIELFKCVIRVEYIESNSETHMNAYGHKQQIKKECYDLMKRIWEEW